MLWLLMFLSCLGLLFSPVHPKACNPANHICSGKCQTIPSGVRLREDVAICMKDSATGGCVCWLQSQIVHVDNFFLCEAEVNGSVSQVVCQIPQHCFPPDSEPTCLVIPRCSCLLMNDGSSLKEFKRWKPVKAIVNLSANLEKYPDTIREFSLKHLLFLLGFVIVPLICWCLLNFYNEGKCKRKQSSSPETRRRSNVVERHDPSEEESMCLNTSTSHGIQPPCSSSSMVFVTSGISENGVAVSVISSPTAKTECPPSYDEAMTHQPVEEEDDDENDPPPTYDDAVQGRDGSPRQMWQTVLVIHSRPCENV